MTTPVTDKASRLAEQLETLATVGEAAGIDSLVKEIREERLPALAGSSMNLVVLGEFNHGKSSVINALLGVDVLPTGITPTTSVITHIRGGTGPARVVRDDATDEMDNEKLFDVITNDPPNDLRHVEVHVESDLLTDGLLVVDTPGVNDISRQKVEITYGYVPRADVIVYVLDATQALKRSEVTFIRDRLLKNAIDRVFFVLGKSDALDDAELAEVEQHVRDRLRDLVGEVDVYPLSARRALKGNDPGFEKFRAAVVAYVKDQRHDIVLESGVRAAKRIAMLMDQSLAIEVSTLRLSAEELETRVKSVRKKLANSRMAIRDNVILIEQRAGEITAMSRENLREFIGGFVATLPREIERARVDDVKRYLADFIQDTFKDWVEGEGVHVAMQLEKLAEDVISITNRNMREAMDSVNDELGIKARDLNFEVDTFGYDVGVFAVLSLGVTFLALSNLLVGGLLTLAAPLLAFVVKDRVDDKIRERAITEGTAAIQRAGEKLEEELVSVVVEFADKLRSFVEDAGDRLYRQVVEALDRAIAERRDYEGDIKDLGTVLVARRAEIAKVVSALQELAPKAEPNAESKGTGSGGNGASAN